MPQLNIHQIRKILPHRYPFLLVDRVEDIDYGKSIHAIKNVTVNEPCFTGHFPEYPVMPGGDAALPLQSLHFHTVPI